MRIRLGHLSRDVEITLVAGFVSLVANWLAIHSLYWGVISQALPFPIKYTNPNPDACGFGPLGQIGCFSIDPLQLALDCVFWTGTTLAIVTFSDWITTRIRYGIGDGGRDKSPGVNLGLLTSSILAIIFLGTILTLTL